MMARLRDDSGFTLGEVLVTITLMLILLGTTLTVLTSFERTTSINRQQTEAQDTARAATGLLAREFRNLAGPLQSVPDAIERAEPYDLVFLTIAPSGQTSTENPGNALRLRYCLEHDGSGFVAQPNGTYRLIRQEQVWDGDPGTTIPSTANRPASLDCDVGGTPDTNPTDPNAWHSERVVAESIVNRGRPAGNQSLYLFDTRDPVCAGSSISAGCLSDIEGIRTQLFVDVNPGRRPSESTLTTGVFLRNQNRRPIASFTATQQGPNTAVLNASFSDDPESGKLSYRWFIGGVTDTECNGPPATNDPCEFSTSGPIITHNFGAPGTYPVYLEVSDPASLKGVAGPIDVEVTDGGP